MSIKTVLSSTLDRSSLKAIQCSSDLEEALSHNPYTRKGQWDMWNMITALKWHAIQGECVTLKLYLGR